MTIRDSVSNHCLELGINEFSELDLNAVSKICPAVTSESAAATAPQGGPRAREWPRAALACSASPVETRALTPNRRPTRRLARPDQATGLGPGPSRPRRRRQDLGVSRGE